MNTYEFTVAILNDENGQDFLVVDDSEGGRWVPDSEAREEIGMDQDAAIAMCLRCPGRGEWIQ